MPLRPLSICIVSREFPPDSAFGGIAPVVQREARALAEAGNQVHVLTLSAGPDRVEVDQGVVVHRLADVGVSAADSSYIQAGLWSQKLAALYQQLDHRYRFDVLQCQDYYGESLHFSVRSETLRVSRLHGLSSLIEESYQDKRSPGAKMMGCLEVEALKIQSQLILAPSELAARNTLEGVKELRDRPLELIPPWLDIGRFPALQQRGPDGVLRLLLVGRLEPLKRPELALRTLARIIEDGTEAHLTLVGRDVMDRQGRSYRRQTLIPLMRELGLGFGQVRFVDQLDQAGVIQHMRHSDVVLCPSAYETANNVCLEAIASSRPVIAARNNGISTWLDEAQGYFRVDDSADKWVAQAAEVAVRDGLYELASAGAERLSEICDAEALAERQMSAYLSQLDPPAEKPHSQVSLGIVMLAHNQLDYTKAAVLSLQAKTDTDWHLYLVDNASTDGTADWVEALGDERVTLLHSQENLGVSGGRNLGIAKAMKGNHDYVVFLDNDVSLGADWWRPFVEALQADPQAGIAGERGVRLAFQKDGRSEMPILTSQLEAADMVVGFCMFMTPEAVGLIGDFDENLGLFWHDDDDYGLRARRLGFRILHIGSGLVEHFEHKSSQLVEGIWEGEEQPAELSFHNQAYLAGRQEFLLGGANPLPDTDKIAGVAFVEDLEQNPGLINGWAEQMSDKSGVTLVLASSSGMDADESVERVERLCEKAGCPEFLNLDLMVPQLANSEIAAFTDFTWASLSVPYEFHAPPRFSPDTTERLSEFIDRRLSRIAVPELQMPAEAAF